MQIYQLHIMHSDGGIHSIEMIDADSDITALASASSFSSHRRKELWQGSRRIQSFERGHGIFQMRRFPFSTRSDPNVTELGEIPDGKRSDAA